MCCVDRLSRHPKADKPFPAEFDFCPLLADFVAEVI
jgi:hypothetical protein